MDEPSSRRPKSTRLEDLAELAGVSISTVSRALNDSPAVNLRTKEHIWELARKMDYPFRRSMPAGPIGAQATIAVVVPMPQSRDNKGDDPFLAHLLGAITTAARERGCDVLYSHISPRNYDDLSTAMKANRADGVIFIGQSFLRAEFNRLVKEETRFVVWGAEFKEQNYCSIGSDNPAGGRRATSHLLRLGRRKIVFLGDIQAPEAAQRHRGYLQAHEREGVDVVDELLIPAHFEVESAEGAIENAIDAGLDFEGIVAASDLMAIGAMRALDRLGRKVPEDISVVGYDDIPIARLIKPALTTIRQETTLAGRKLVSKLLDGQAAIGRSERIPTDLIVRETCGG